MKILDIKEIEYNSLYRITYKNSIINRIKGEKKEVFQDYIRLPSFITHTETGGSIYKCKTSGKFLKTFDPISKELDKYRDVYFD